MWKVYLICELFFPVEISLIKSAAEWTTDLKKLGEIVTGEGKARECKNGLSYQAYINSCYLR